MPSAHQDSTPGASGASGAPGDNAGRSSGPGPGPTGAVTAEDLLRQAFRYQDALVSYAYGLLQDWALAQDAVQESFIVLQRKHAQFKPGASLFAWVRQIVRFEALNLLRSRRREACFVDEELISLVDQQFEKHLDADAVDALETRKVALQYCLGQLDEPSLGLLLGFYRDAFSCERLSQIQRRSVNAVRLSLSRIRARVRDCVRHRLALPDAPPTEVPS